METLPDMQDVFGQLPRMKGYTHLVLCFAHPPSISRETIVQALEAAARRLTATFPWLAGKVINTGVGPGCTGAFIVEPCYQTENILRFQDRADDCPSYEDIVRMNGASDLLDGSLLSAETSLPDSYTETDTSPAPALTLTVSWIRNGLLLNCAAQHNVLDMGGIDQIFGLLATALQGREFGKTAIEINNCDRLTVFPLLGPEEPKCDHGQMRRPSSLNPSLRSPPPPGPQPAFHHFRFSAAHLADLTNLSATPSTDDALSAFVWKRLSAVRFSLGQLPDAVAGFSRAVDCRRTLGVPAEYMGVLVVKIFSTMTFKELDNTHLAAVAAHLRRDVQRIRDRYFLRSLATLIAEEPDKSTFNFVPGFRPDTWINASSWASVGAYGLEFGVLGKPAVVRRPRSKPVQSLLYFLPRLECGDINVLLCLKETEIQGLRSDAEWAHYAEYIG
ncbi:hypothetical protein NUU61_007468 [Penicillium alfredii]|uniref:Trichothecene 3-O-acetyltransferase-like N-terminal domain-containing protein n=1 Tax=Penicillium alfredii TaxID=1506179 RepID=A0A9W9F2S0_9EURO|nr:uncharacterized protein NUU61_007468 [Penicillium alfredii]KAJ5092598.1 hypothetical protein NUU61_007468 [Penicillium alfredii]